MKNNAFIVKTKRIVKKIPWGKLAYITVSSFLAQPCSQLVTNGIYNGVARFGYASTGIRINELNGIARENATWARIAKGSLATGGKGIEGGKAKLRSIQKAINASIQTSERLILSEDIQALSNHDKLDNSKHEQDRLDNDYLDEK